MTCALLDHPWPFEKTIDAGSDGFRVLERFVDLARRHHLSIVPFLTWEQLADVWGRIDPRHRHTSGFAALRRSAGLFAPMIETHCVAAPNPEPPGLTQEWKFALNGSLVDVEDWRSPQLVIPDRRLHHWPATNEVDVQIEPCDDLPGSGPHRRVLASLDSYESHPFAEPDLDPWDLRYIHAVCRLPKPPFCDGIAFEDLGAALENARATGWIIGRNHYFIPPVGWRPRDVEKTAWREARAFPRRMVPEAPTRNKMGYVDYRGKEWIWHAEEMHWDVQTDPYVRLRCTGAEV
jgi:hypothetical protein